MTKNRIIDLVLLICVFSVSFTSGYFLCEFVIPERVVKNDVEPLPKSVIQEETVNNTAGVETLVIKDTQVAEPEELEELEEQVESAEPERIIYEPYTSQQMEALINGADYEKRPVNSKLIFQAVFNNIIVHNLREGDKHPDDVAELCAKVGDGVWLRVTGTVVIANEQNIITRIETNAVYPEE